MSVPYVPRRCAAAQTTTNRMNQQQARTAIEQIFKTLAATAFPDAKPTTAPQTHGMSASDFLDGKIDLPASGAATTVPKSAASTVALPLQTARVAVRRPDGTPTTIPAVHLKAALQFGYKLINQ